MSVILQPSYALAFNRPFIKNVMRPLYITNPNADPIQFKIKTNAPMLYAVRPNQGRVNPGKAVEVLVMLRAKEEEPPLDVKCRNKFLVQSILISPEKTSVPLVELWSTLPIRSHKLRVNYLPPEGHPLDSPTVKAGTATGEIL
ncbi:PapD-like protein [Russula earlei]|uniref:PapD-like protein n=1 Tax=Russula earlei TaxID=71964 RepID=A0ACC0UL32_9AGAM|nr:PapD-like protein [Russula earlei]